MKCVILMTLEEQLTKIINAINHLDIVLHETNKYLYEHIDEGSIYDVNINIEDEILEINKNVTFNDEELNKILKKLPATKYQINDTYYIPLRLIIAEMRK